MLTIPEEINNKYTKLCNDFSESMTKLVVEDCALLAANQVIIWDTVRHDLLNGKTSPAELYNQYYIIKRND